MSNSSARSIVLLWYLGSWYSPDDLKRNAHPGHRAFIPSQVVSAKAIRSGLVWQIAQAHPMGYSNLQFGYWSRDPNDPNDAVIDLISASSPQQFLERGTWTGNCIKCDVAIIGSGFAGALIAKELSPEGHQRRCSGGRCGRPAEHQRLYEDASTRLVPKCRRAHTPRHLTEPNGKA